MPLHFNIRTDIYRETHTDDEYGGAVATGTIVYPNEPGRIDYYMPRQRTELWQGMETNKMYSFFFHTNQQHPLLLQENDAIVVTFPPHHVEYLKQFRVIGVSYEATHPSDAHGILEVTCQRIEKSRGIDL